MIVRIVPNTSRYKRRYAIKWIEYTKGPTVNCRSLYALVRLAGLEPARALAHHPLKMACLPFHHNRMEYKMVPQDRIELSTRIFSPLLYQLSYRGMIFVKKMATPIRFELTIFAVTGRHVNRYTTGPRINSR